MVSVSIAEITTRDDISNVKDLLRRHVQWFFDSFPDETEDLQSYFSPERMQQALDDVSTMMCRQSLCRQKAWL
jgi:hypothetical protein